jgi:two-component system NtrC family sensor kinase
LAPYVWIKISDDGCGIPEEVLGKIFYPFFTTKERGSGIGLAIAQKIIDSHRGSIDVESEVGRGTTFTVKLPLLP